MSNQTSVKPTPYKVPCLKISGFKDLLIKWQAFFLLRIQTTRIEVFSFISHQKKYYSNSFDQAESDMKPDWKEH